jgi:hypothetical protein
MILGLTPLVFVHTLISLAGIATGVVVMAGFLANARRDGWNNAFLATTILTSATGFILPAAKLMPSHAVGVLSLAILAIACYARYAKKMAGSWRLGYVLTAVAAQYFNVFVLVAQLFAKVPALHAMAPTQSEPPFVIVQGLVLLAYVIVGVLAARHFHPAAAAEDDIEDIQPA